MFEDVVLHIGLHRTATSFLQQKIFPEIEGYYTLTRPYTQLNHAFNQLQYADDSLYDESAVRNELVSLTCSKLILSDESFSGKPIGWNLINRTLIANRFHKLLPEARVIIFLRGQLSYINSFYNQSIKAGHKYGYKSVEDFIYVPQRSYSLEDYRSGVKKAPQQLYYDSDDFSLHLNSCCYHPLIVLYKSLFKEVKVVLFEDLNEDPEATLNGIQDFFHLSRRRHFQLEKINSSVKLATLKRKSALKRAAIVTENALLKKLLGSLLTIGGSDRFTMSPSLRKELTAYYRDDNRLLIQRFPELSLDRYKDQYPQ